MVDWLTIRSSAAAVRTDDAGNREMAMRRVTVTESCAAMRRVAVAASIS